MGRVGATARPSAPQHVLEHLDVVVIGAGISGISVGRYLATGEVRGGPARTGLTPYPVAVREGRIVLG